MKRALFLGLLCVAGVVCARDVQAQVNRQQAEVKYLRVPHRFQIYVDGGSALPAAPGLWNDYWNSAFTFGAGFGVSIEPWLEVNGTINRGSFTLNAIKAKSKIDYSGIEDVQGGSVTTMVFSGSVRFLGVPKQRTNPYVEIGVGAFKTKGEDVFIEGSTPNAPEVVHNKMKDVSGISVWPAAGIQYAMNDHWSSYARFTYMINLNKDFAPGDLLLPVNATEPTVGGDQVISSISVGIMLRF